MISSIPISPIAKQIDLFQELELSFMGGTFSGAKIKQKRTIIVTRRRRNRGANRDYQFDIAFLIQENMLT